MKNMNRLLFLLLFTLIGVCMINTCNHEKKRKITTDYEQQLKTLKQVQKEYQSNLKNYQRATDSLTSSLSKTDSALKAEKVKLSVTKVKLKAALESNWEDITLEEKLDKCDTLREVTKEYSVSQNSIDSLTEDKICNLEEQIKEKDNQLINCDEAYNDFKTAFESSIDSHMKLSEDYNKLVKKNNRQVLKSKLLSIAVGILSTSVATLIIAR